MAHGPDTERLLERISQATDNLYISNAFHDLHITSLPTLPDSVKLLHIHLVSIHTLPTLPSALEELIIIDTPITELPSFPPTVRYIRIHNTQLTKLPPLPPTLVYLNCYVNMELTELPQLPSSLKTLWCGYTLIPKLPDLPDSLEKLGCQNTPITELPPLPPSLRELDCSNCPNLIIQRLKGESIQDYSARWEEYRNKKRIQERCLSIKEELMAAAWHPRRIERWINTCGIEVLDVM